MMKRLVVMSLSVLLLFTGFTNVTEAASTVKSGAQCSKVSQKITVGRNIYQCRKSGNYLVWRLIATMPAPVPTPKPVQFSATGLPTTRLASTSPGLLGLVDRTADASPWAQYYGTGLAFKDGYIKQGATVTLTWYVLNAQGKPLPHQAVTLLANKGWGGSNATFTCGTYTVVNSAGTQDGARIPGVTDAQGLIRFTIKDTSLRSEPADTSTKVKSTYPVPVFGQFALQVADTEQKKLSMDIVNIHVIGTGLAPSPTPIPSGSLLWSEEFTGAKGTAPSSANWTHLLGNGYDQLGFYNYGTGEIESNTVDATAYDGNGNLVITTKKENGVWKSARIWTQGKVNFLYGKIEIRIKLPSGSFNWPAFWMLGSNYQPPNQRYGTTPWPNSGEIDIMEVLRGNTTVQSTIHANNLGTYSPWNGGGGLTAYAPSTDVTSGFHTFTMLWKPNMMSFSFDGIEYGKNSFNGSSVVQSIQGAEVGRFDSNGVWPFNNPFFLILNNAVPPGTTGFADGTSSTTVVDWIRYSTYDGYGTLNP